MKYLTIKNRGCWWLSD